MKPLLFPLVSFVLISMSAGGEETPLEYAPAPVDNPLKGFVPYVEIDGWERFPHSLEFHYFPLRDLMKGPDSFDWTPIEDKLAVTQARGCQLVIRVMAEYPGRPSQIPGFLVEAGVNITVWTSPDGDESHTPDYENPAMRTALVSVIEALGKEYDGDPRIGYFTAGLLGSWGEWHNYPRSDLWASRETQGIILDAFEASFEKTPVLLRYPAGEGHYDQAENASRPFGYHDDSFDWATLATGKEEDSWFFMSLLEDSGALEKWKTQPIGGEVRPELWARSFTVEPHPKAQGFSECIEATHVTWLMDSGLFARKFDLPEERKARAIKAAQMMGYEFFVSSWKRDGDDIQITVQNKGVAPLYHDWPVELARGEETIARFELRGLLPGEERIWTAKTKEGGPFRLRVPNPMEGGRPLRFANAGQNDEWLDLP